ncbi:DODA-type extradiol aromatic ring-opening family dioxygenase [Thiomicrorhabdus sediminis]|uniref:Dioxygenase n=1 Tax=Thiomicrorhabdus sediminis TaxID=2580412 RepID=A0A4P9K516_9GAMM|nr:class III extradiol ring-cleavage dioxygenase [Thiomicrorhabdus sediminis]QCU90059.1 dioxygenase [Thiomicrorhabdus sediminis]
MSNKQICFISHGGGPLPLLQPKNNQQMIDTLLQIRKLLTRPKAILVISAHWEASRPTITAGKNPQLIYDYSGFPDAAYHIEYPCRGEPQLAQALYKALNRAGLNPVLDEARGFDHGLYVPLKILYPDADIPCVQLSLLDSLNAQKHIALGEVLAGLDFENLLIIGSGFSFHNMRAFFSDEGDKERQYNIDFENWLVQTLSDMAITEDERRLRLTDWLKVSPAARYNHPREEHLLPLHVCYGAAQSACDKFYRLQILTKQTSMYVWYQ